MSDRERRRSRQVVRRIHEPGPVVQRLNVAQQILLVTAFVVVIFAVLMHSAYLIGPKGDAWEWLYEQFQQELILVFIVVQAGLFVAAMIADRLDRQRRRRDELYLQRGRVRSDEA